MPQKYSLAKDSTTVTYIATCMYNCVHKMQAGGHYSQQERS